jgi:hypothetical protein
MPRFVEAPQGRLVPLESKGAGAKPDYSSMTREQLKKLAKADNEAWNALIDKSRTMSDAELRILANKKGDADARAVLNERTSPNSEALKKALDRDYRPPHTAEVTVRRGNQVVAQQQYNSGNMTPQEAALGWPRNLLATHTP